MISILGHLSLAAAIIAAGGGLLAAVASLRLDSDAWRRAARGMIVLVALLLTAASAALIVALVTSDFRFDYVASYTERALPLGYRLAAFWAGQEGSLLLWGWMIASLGAIAVYRFRRLGPVEEAGAVATLAVVSGFFAVLLLFAADPFALLEAPPADGRGLNPMLQDPAMIAHPPLLFLGYAATTIPFAVFLGVLAAGRADSHWIADVRRWILFAWLFLTAGIVLGAWWAYVELGWGGYWAWDPVENASLLPWLTATALLHSLIVQQHRGMFKRWNAFLLSATFLLCIFGTFITRSGVINSVHSFAPSLIGTFFLVSLIVGTIVPVGLAVWRRRTLRSEHPIDAMLSREGFFLLGNIVLTVMTLTVLVGTIFPLISGLFVEDAITVKAPFYNRVVAPMGVLLVALMSMGPVLAFGRGAPLRILRRLAFPAAAAAIVVVGTVVLLDVRSAWALVCVAIAAVGTGAVIDDVIRGVAARRHSTGESWAVAFVRLVDRDHRRFGGMLAHLGAMILVVGVVGSSLFSEEKTLRVSPGERVAFAGRTVEFVGLEQIRDVNFTAFQATLYVDAGGGDVRVYRPQTRFYDTWRDSPNTEVALGSGWRGDLYVTVLGWEGGGAVTAIQLRSNPLVLWIWIGGVIMVVAALFGMLPPLLPRAHHAAHPVRRAVPAASEADAGRLRAGAPSPAALRSPTPEVENAR